jgi:hypothetical protein
MKIILKELIVAISAILLFQCSCKPQKQVNHDFFVKINQISKVRNDTLGWNDAIFYSIDLSLVNNSDSTINFWMWTCAWDWNFISNKKDAFILGPECPKNIQTIWNLEKKQKIDFNGLIAVLDSTNLDLEVRIGFIYIQKNEGQRLIEITPPPPGDSVLFKMHNKHENVIWSDSFKLK